MKQGPVVPHQTKTRRRVKNSFISEEVCAFSPCCCQEMNKWLSMLGGYISHLRARFSQLIPFSPYKAGNEISLSAVSPRAPSLPPSPTPSSLPFHQDIPCGGEEEGASSPSSKREVVWSNNAACTSGLSHNRAVSIYRIIRWRVDFLPYFPFGEITPYHVLHMLGSGSSELEKYTCAHLTCSAWSGVHFRCMCMQNLNKHFLCGLNPNKSCNSDFTLSMSTLPFRRIISILAQCIITTKL